MKLWLLLCCNIQKSLRIILLSEQGINEYWISLIYSAILAGFMILRRGGLIIIRKAFNIIGMKKLIGRERKRLKLILQRMKINQKNGCRKSE